MALVRLNRSDRGLAELEKRKNCILFIRSEGCHGFIALHKISTSLSLERPALRATINGSG